MQYEEILEQNITDLASVYLAYGEDEYLLRKFLDEFISCFVSDEFSTFNLNIIKESADLIPQIVNAAETLPFMVEKRIVIVHTYNLFTQKTKDIDTLYSLLDEFPDTTTLLFVSHKKPDKRMKLYKKVSKIGKILEFSSLKYKKLDEWIKNKAQQEGYQINIGAIKLLEEAFNNDLQKLKNELEKIMTFVGSKKVINKADVEAIISKDWLVKDNIIFDFVDAIGHNNVSLALELLSVILEEGTEPKQILVMIARQIRLMLQTKLLSQQGLRIKEIAKELKQHPYPVEKCLKQSRNFSIKSLEEALEELSKTDYKLVTGADQELELELLVINLKEAI
ncbi:DNA polymerase III, delta subunit [Halobacteroides halobius DSM 5150]|uniref:DNA polymerase III subunit delta n=1 Tax=Halobacteroides halobius (strain ATCC 35273 / DSM 5150 / MD-1) TaxID=748449 RepID=L0KCN2_HALHC|nr:DNA polymerase III subunit delta [Halobacteroides halobius]AGB41818.1 DNA polymerase III, delta subunit [Halobacteroides halobius DSM 5150]